MMVTADAQLQLRWHSHTSTFTSMLSDLHNQATFSDVVMCCQGGRVDSHRAVLSLCSPYLAKMLGSFPSDATSTLMLPEVPVKDVLYLMSFIYCGQVDVPQADIASFLNTGKHLQVLGLELGERLVASPEPSEGTTSTTNSDTEDDTHSMSSQKSISSAKSHPQLPPPPSSSDVNDNVPSTKTASNIQSQHQILLKQERPSPTGLPLDPTVTIKEERVTSEYLSNSTSDPSFSFRNSATLDNMTTDSRPDFGVGEHIPITTAQPPVPNIIGSDGRIDLNFYLQQAIQCASMPCPLCKKEFRSQSGLRDHIRLHTGERPFICEFCHMNFARASHLKRHRRMHTGEKPFHCNICSKEFSRGDKLKDHLKRHEAEEKLNKIRSQIFNPEECSKDSLVGASAAPSDTPPTTHAENASPGGPVGSLASLVARATNSQALATPAATPSVAQQMPGPVSPSVKTEGIGVVGGSTSALQLGDAMASLVARANTQAVTPNSVMSAKTSVANAFMQRQLQLQQQTLQVLQQQAAQQQHQQAPPSKKQKLSSTDTSLTNLNSQPKSELLPQMLGVASIGECILRPIN